MPYQEIAILLPCHSLEDFPTHYEGDDAQGLLAGWTALWHPLLLADVGTMPKWYRVDSPPEELAERLLVIPSVAVADLPTGFAQRAKDAGACVVRRKGNRAEILEQALKPFEGAEKFDADLAADFLALGYCYLQIQLLTRQMRYSSNLDEIYFEGQLIAAAKAAVANDGPSARESLQRCFDVLSQERDHYYPVDAYILDLTLLAETTLGPALREELTDGTVTNLLAAAELGRLMGESEPESLAALRAALEENKASLAGSAAAERRWPLLSAETVWRELARGGREYEEIFGRRPSVFGARRFGWTPLLPALLKQAGFRGALHMSFDGGRIPEGSHSKTQWEGTGGVTLESLAKPPLDAAKPETFLSYALRLGESMDMDHVAVLCLAHWPGAASPWYGDLRRISRYAGALGKFVSLDTFFTAGDGMGQVDRFQDDQYRSPYLQQAVIRRQADPLGSVRAYWRREAAVSSLNAIEALGSLVSGDAAAPRSAELASKHDALGDETLSEEAAAGFSSALEQANEAAAGRLAQALSAGSSGDTGVLLLNPLPFVRRVGLELPAGAGLPPAEKPVYAAGEASGRGHAGVDLPPLGFVWLPRGGGASGGKKRGDKPLAEEGVLRNEFFEAHFSPETGCLAALYEYNVRGNRLSQRLSFRLPEERPTAGEAWQEPVQNYSIPAAESLEVTFDSFAMGELTSRGRLLGPEGEELAKFTQVFRVWRGSRVLGVTIELEPLTEPQADPWNSYFACRFAWPDEGAELRMSRHGFSSVTSARRFEAPQFYEIDNGSHRTAILTGGLPFHRRVGHNQCDTLLVVRGERARRFELGIGIDLKNPLHEALSLLTPPVVLPAARAPKNSSGWLFHLDQRNVLATWWEPLVEQGKVTGFTVRLQETAGRSTRVTLHGFRPIAAARFQSFAGEVFQEAPLHEGGVRIELAGHEWQQLVCRW